MAGASRCVLKGQKELASKAQGPRSLSARLCVSAGMLPAAISDHRRQPHRPGNAEGCPGTMGVPHSSPLDTASAPMASRVSPCLGCSQASSGAGLGAEKLCLRNHLHPGGPGRRLSNMGMGVCGGGMDLLFHDQSDWLPSTP